MNFIPLCYLFDPTISSTQACIYLSFLEQMSGKAKETNIFYPFIFLFFSEAE